MTIDGWDCVELYPGTDWSMRTASLRNVEFEADCDGLRVTESYHGYSGASGSNAVPANVLMWLVQAVRL